MVLSYLWGRYCPQIPYEVPLLEVRGFHVDGASILAGVESLDLQLCLSAGQFFLSLADEKLGQPSGRGLIYPLPCAELASV